MHKQQQPSPRYEIWSAGKSETKAATPEKALQTLTKHSAQTQAPAAKLDELGTSLLLYSYGLPVETALSGVCTLPGGRSTKVATRKISTESVDLVYEDSPFHLRSRPHDKIKIGSPVQLDIEEIGAVGGVMASQKNNGFQVAVDSSHRTMLSGKLAAIAAKNGIMPKASFAAGPSVTRIEPKNKKCKFEDHHGELRNGTIVNLSQSDALIRASIIPPIPAIIVFRGPRRYAAEVTSTFEIGFVVHFCSPIPDIEFSPDMIFSDA